MSIYIEPGDIIIYPGTKFQEVWGGLTEEEAGGTFTGIIRERNSAKTIVAELTITPDAENLEIELTLDAEYTAVLNPEIEYDCFITIFDGEGTPYPFMEVRVIVNPWETEA